MAGIYIHIPFCKQACHYCDFHFSTNQQTRKELVAAISKEIILQEVSERYQFPASLQETMLRKVLDAFLRLKNLSDDERRSISEALVAAKEPGPVV